jgi:hypothetical protein
VRYLTTPLCSRLVDSQIRLRCEGHIRAYADILWGWDHLILRAELLKNSRVWDVDKEQVLSEHCCYDRIVPTPTLASQPLLLCAVNAANPRMWARICALYRRAEVRVCHRRVPFVDCLFGVGGSLVFFLPTLTPLIRSRPDLPKMSSRDSCWMLAADALQVERPMRLRMRLPMHWCRRKIRDGC